MTSFNPYPYSITGPSGGSGGPMPSQPLQAPASTGSVIVSHSREIDLRTISGDVDPPVLNTFYQRDFLLIVPTDCAIERLRLSAGHNGTGVSFAFELIQLDQAGVKQTLIPSTEVRSLDLLPTDYESAVEVELDVPVILRVVARYQQVTVFATLEALYTSVQE